MTTLRAVKRRLNPGLSVFGVLLTMFDGRTNFLGTGGRGGTAAFSGQGLCGGDPAQRAPCRGTESRAAVMAYDRFSRGAAAYEQVAQEIIAKE